MFIRLMFCCFVISNLLIANMSYAKAQTNDTLAIDIHQAEKIFLDNNLQLLAQKQNVSAAKALIIQARLWPNPNVSYTIGAYNFSRGTWFGVHDTSEQAAQVSQLILLAGKIKKQVKVAEANYKLAEYGLYDVLRTLKFGLRSSFYNIYYMQQTSKVYKEEINALKKIVKAFEQQEGKGYIAEIDVVRVQAQLYALQSEYQNLVDNINDQQSQIRLLLQVKPAVYLIPVVDTANISRSNPQSYGLQTLLDSAYEHRTDLMIAKGNLYLSQQNYAYQKALAVPDLTVGLVYDKRGSYTPNFNGINVGMNIPIFNRNQGNIKNTKLLIDYNTALMQSTQKTLEDQIIRGQQRAVDADKLYKEIDPAFASHFDKLAKAVMENYLKRNIKLLDFLSFYDSYKQNIVQLNTTRYNRLNTLENLNFLTGTTLFNK